MTHAANADLVAIVRAGRKLNRLLGGYASTTAATALGADRLERARTKQEGQVDVDVPAATAARAGMGMLGGDRTRAAAVTTGIEARIADGLAGTALGLLGVEFDIDDHVGAVLGIVGSLAATLLAIFFFGGETIRGFIFALALGVVVGTLSTLFVATPIAYGLMKREGLGKK